MYVGGQTRKTEGQKQSLFQDKFRVNSALVEVIDQESPIGVCVCVCVGGGDPGAWCGFAAERWTLAAAKFTNPSWKLAVMMGYLKPQWAPLFVAVPSCVMARTV